MKTKLFAMLALALTLAITAFASRITVTGVLTDDMCTRKHMMPGKTNADCVHECINHGAEYVVASEGRVLRLSGNQELFSGLAGKKVKLLGSMKGRTLVVLSLEPAQ